MTDNLWTESSSDMYRRIASVAVPARAEQFAALLTLFPFSPDDTFRVVELASGEGKLAHGVLSAFPNATLLALDVEPSMRQETENRLGPFGSRASVAAFDMRASDWYDHLNGADVVISSLCIHHLDGNEKQGLFNAVCSRLSPRGAFLIADIILHQRLEARELFAATYDRAVEAQSLEQTGSTELYQRFTEADWNYYRVPDDFDKPSPLFDQLVWLKSAGFAVVDCFWMRAGHAVYGGYKSADAPSSSLNFLTALTTAERSLNG